MTNFDATTPQLKILKDVTEAYMARDLNRVAPYLSKDFTYQTFPEIVDLPSLEKGEHIEKYGAVLGSFSKLDVRD